MINKPILLVLIVQAAFSVSKSEHCPGPFDFARLLRESLLPSWSRLTPRDVAEAWPSPLLLNRDGMHPVLSQRGAICSLTFDFRAESDNSDRLDSVTYVLNGPEHAIVDAAHELLRPLEITLNSEESQSLKRGDPVDLSRRIPSDPKVPGILQFITLKLYQERGGLLTFYLRQVSDK